MSGFAGIRVLGIIVACAGTLAVLGRTLLTELPIEPTPVPVNLAGASPPAGWEMLAGAPDPNFPNTIRYRHASGPSEIDLETQFIADLPVHYIRNSELEMRFLPRGHLPLDAGLHFYVNSRGRIIANLRNDAPSEALVDARETAPRSGYGIWIADQRLHLSTILTPAGDTSMVTRRVARSIYLDPVNATRLGQWLLGRRMLPDRRCVLIHFSIPAAQPEGRRLLEDAWEDWQLTFHPVFPE